MLRDTERAVSRAAAHVALGGTLDRRASAQGQSVAAPLSLVAGSTVRLKKLGSLAVVDAPPERGQVRLRAGGMKLTVAVEDVELAKPGTRVVSAPAPKRVKNTARTLQVAVRTPSNTLDLRGQRVEEALERVDAFLDVMMGEGESLGFVLHGHGTGAMKLAVRAHLAASKYVEHSRPAEADEGGDAFTIFWMKE
jgi:DNA mismatch repair protein MutS2